MGLEQRSAIYGFHQLTAYDVKTKLPLGTAKVVGAATFAFTGETIELSGGSSSYPWAVENGKISSELTITIKEYPDWLFEAFNGQKVVNAAAESGGYAGELTAANGTDLLDASTGIASVGVKSGKEADVKTGTYVIKAVSATTVDVYAYTDVEFGQGTDAEYVDETLKINETPLSIVSATATEIPGFGVEITGGSGTIALTEGDTATFKCRSINSGSSSVKVGQNTDNFKEVGLILTGQKQSDGKTIEIDVFKAKGIGLPFNLTEKEFSESEITMKAFRDEARNGVYQFNKVQADS